MRNTENYILKSNLSAIFIHLCISQRASKKFVTMISNCTRILVHVYVHDIHLYISLFGANPEYCQMFSFDNKWHKCALQRQNRFQIYIYLCTYVLFSPLKSIYVWLHSRQHGPALSFVVCAIKDFTNAPSTQSIYIWYVFMCILYIVWTCNM